ncbi:MAG TPA: hypothetical protein VN039_11890, partial [Nitrospira sp.]|nr:hypothetical protein [Nitrospira sp.]
DASPTEISSTTSSAGQAGRVHIVTPTMHLDDWAVVSTSSQSTGHAGSVVLDVGRLDLLRGARIESSGLERSGGVVINAAKSITLDKGTITTDALNPGQTGQSGNVSLHAGQSILIGNGSRISADTAKDVSDIVRQDAGNIVIQAGKSVVVRDSTVSARAQAETGNSGTIVIDAGKNFVSEASTLSVAAASPAGGDSGQIRVTAGDSVRLRNGTVLDGTNAGPGGDGAHIVLDAGKHVVVDASRVITPVLEGGSGRIEMHAGKDVRLVNGTVMDASAGARVPGGQIVVDAGRNILVDASQVRVPVGDGGTGQIVMHAEKDVRLVNGTVLDASSEASGGGQIVVTGGNVVIDNSRLTADTAAGSFGNAGKVTVIADGSVRLLNGTLVTASSPIFSSGGQVSVTAGDSVQLRNSTIQTSGTFGGGTIVLTSETVRLKNGRLVSSASEDVGGTITIKTNDFRRDAASVLDVSGSIANGTINIEPLP